MSFPNPLSSFPLSHKKINIVDGTGYQTWPYMYTNIGLNRTKADDWTWVNGQPMTWTNWVGGGPSNSGGNEKCVEMLTWDPLKHKERKFNDVSCEYNPGRAETACQMPMGKPVFSGQMIYIEILCRYMISIILMWASTPSLR